MRVAIIGGGFGVSAHLPAFAATLGVQVVVLADAGSGRARLHATNGIRYASSWESALEQQGLEAVSIAAPPGHQRQIVLNALERGLHVFCEKPFGSSVNDAEAMLRRVRERGLTGAVNFQFRFEPGIEAMRETLRAGAIGRLLGMDLSWLTVGRARIDSPWSWQHDAAAGGGVVGAFFSHAADLFYWLSDAEPESVFGQTAILIPQRRDRDGQTHTVTAEDYVAAQITLTGGVVATCRISNCQVGGQGMQIELRGDNGLLVYRSQPPYRLQDCALQLFRDRRSVESLPISVGTGVHADDPRVLAVSRCVGCFVRLVQGDKEAYPPNFQDGLRVHRLMQALRGSADSGHNTFLTH